MTFNAKRTNMKRTLVITSAGFPPYTNSVAILVRNLFYFIPRQSYVVLLNRPEKEDIRLNLDQIIDHDYVYINTSVFERFNFIKRFKTICLLMINAIRIFKNYSISNILVIPLTSDNYEVIAYLVSKLFHKPLFVYLFDIYYTPDRVNRAGIINNVITKYFEPILLKAADEVFVMSESLKKYYDDKYRIDSVYLPHSIIVSNYKQKRKRSTINHEKRMIYAGMIYEAHYDSILNVVKAVNCLEDYNIRFYLYTPRTKQKLQEMGIKGENIEIRDFVQPEKIISILYEADILILPMAFNSPFPDVIKTASPGKLPVYLASGTPILVHAPKESYVANYFRKHNCGIVVDSQNSVELKNNIKRLIDDDKLKKFLKKNSEITLKNHDAKEVSRVFQRYLKSSV